MLRYNPANWYWLSADERLYSSAAQALIDVAEDGYLTWSAAGNVATCWPMDNHGEQTDAALAAVLAPYGLRLWPASLADVKIELMAAIDAAAETERLRYITAGAGQAMTYQRKVDEARRFQLSGDVDPANYPMLSATVGIDGDTLADVAQLVLDMDAQWAVVGAAIEHARMSAKAAIESAEDEEAARAVMPLWPELAG